MGKLLLTLAASMLLQTSVVNAMQPGISQSLDTAPATETRTTNLTAPHRKVYGFFMNNVNAEGYGIGSFYMANPSQPSLNYSFNDGKMLGFYAGAVANGVFYGCTYQYMSTGMPLSLDMMAIDLLTGERRAVGPWTTDPSLKFQDMTYDYSTNTMYAIGYEYGRSCLYTIDIETGASSKVADLPMRFFTIAANYDGQLFAMSSDNGILFKISKTDGRIQGLVANTEILGFVSIQSMEFDHTDGKLYWAAMAESIDSSRNTHLMQIDVTNGNIVDLGIIRDSSMPFGSPIIGLHIPYVLAGENAPAVLSDIKFTNDETGALKTKIAFTTPSKTFGNHDLTDLSSVTIMRNGEVIAVINATEGGQPIEFVDETVPANGLYKYVLYATNSLGDGEKTHVSSYVGVDAPSEVTNLKVDAAATANGSVISWTAPTVGKHGGYFDQQSTRYKIVRFPDEEILTENWDKTMFIDYGVDRLASYYYQVIAQNEIGSSSLYTTRIVMGPGYRTPYEEDFTDIDRVNNTWTVVDGNNDGHSWQFNTQASRSTFFDTNYIGADYFLNMFLVDPTITSDADEWLITPPISVEANKKYILKFSYRTLTDDVLDITCGTNNTVSTQQLLETMQIHNSGYNGTTDYDSTDKQYHTKQIELNGTDGVITVGFHLRTPFPENYEFGNHLQIQSVRVEEGQLSGLSSTDTEGLDAWANNGILTVVGEFDYAVLSNTKGAVLLETSKEHTSIASLPAGVYVVSIVKGNNVKTIKIIVC